ncbi:hypothetical protein HHI36_015534 [Cryptolaemus montrouzieri]|uniref:Uncharacterized protein n=1 Tax=Cryptolaemus montrouzieri TaxID=559131 RepID=A0ABD2N5Z6_9CUCU
MIKAKRDYEEFVATQNKKKLYKHIRNFLSKVADPLLKKPEGEICRNDEEPANNLCQTLQKAFSVGPDASPSPPLNMRYVDASLESIEFSSLEIDKRLKLLKDEKC